MAAGMTDTYRYLWGWFIGDGMSRWGTIEGHERAHPMFSSLFWSFSQRRRGLKYLRRGVMLSFLCPVRIFITFCHGCEEPKLSAFLRMRKITLYYPQVRKQSVHISTAFPILIDFFLYKYLYEIFSFQLRYI